MKLLSSLARALVRPEFVQSLRGASSADEVVSLVDGVVNPAPAAPAAGAAAVPAAGAAALAEPKHAAAATKTVVAITACPTGIAHTYMAADALKLAAERAGVDFVVETQGSSGSTPLAAATIAGADAVIFATDVGVKDRGRFAGKPVIASGVKRAINEPDKMIAEAVAASDNPNAPKVEGAAAAAAESSGGGDVGWGTRTRQILLTGVSYMIPFVAAGGLLIALGLPVRRLRHRQQARGSDPVARQHHRHHQLADQPAQRWLLPVPGRGVVQHRRVGVRVPGSGTGRLHLLRDRRPAGYRAGLHRGCGRRLRRRRVHRRHRRRPDRRLHGPVDRPLQRAALAARIDAGGDHPARRIAGRRPADLHAPRPSARRHHLRPDQLAQRNDGQLGDPAGHHPRADDVLRPRWPGEQGGLRLRRRGAQYRRAVDRCASWPP